MTNNAMGDVVGAVAERSTVDASAQAAPEDQRVCRREEGVPPALAAVTTSAGSAPARVDIAESISRCPVGSPRRSVAAAPTPEGREQSSCPVRRDETGRFIPYITPLKGELPVSMDDVTVRPDGLGLTFAGGEATADRDRNGALWVRIAPAGDGRPIPLFRKVHPRRAAEAMLDMRCQGCFEAPDRNSKGVLFFAKPDPKRPNLYWPETEYTHHPPICLPCAHQAMRHCSFVQHASALRVRNPRPWGVDGLAYALDGRGTLRLRNDVDRCSYDDLKLLPWMLALQPIARLSRCTVVDIQAELAAAGLQLPESPAS